MDVRIYMSELISSIPYLDHNGLDDDVHTVFIALVPGVRTPVVITTPPGKPGGPLVAPEGTQLLGMAYRSISEVEGRIIFHGIAMPEALHRVLQEMLR